MDNSQRQATYTSLKFSSKINFNKITIYIWSYVQENFPKILEDKKFREICSRAVNIMKSLIKFQVSNDLRNADIIIWGVVCRGYLMASNVWTKIITDNNKNTNDQNVLNILAKTNKFWGVTSKEWQRERSSWFPPLKFQQLEGL